MLVYYLIFISVISTILYIYLYKYSKNLSKKVDYMILYIPLIVSFIIMCLSFNIEIPYGNRYLEKSAKSIRYYPRKVETVILDNGMTSISKHDDYYTLVYEDRDGNLLEKEISGRTFEYFSNLWGEKNIIRTDKYEEVKWDNEMKHSLIYTKTESFDNYFWNTIDLYKLKEVSSYTAVRKKLFSRGRLDYVNSDTIIEPRQSLVYGIEVSDDISRSISYISSLDNKFRPILLVWVGDSISSIKSKGQRSYWKGGNDNEVIFCVGITDTITKRILWSDSFSWANNKDLEKFILKNALIPGKSLNMQEYVKDLDIGYNTNLWKPRDFSSYKLIKIPLESFAIMVLCLVIIIGNIIVSTKLINENKGSRKL